MNTLQVVADNPVPTDEKPARIWREQPISEDWLFQATDERGCEGWFLRLCITGLYPRRVGPFPSKAVALAVLEDFILTCDREVLCELQNSMDGNSVYVIESVPTLTAGRTEGGSR